MLQKLRNAVMCRIALSENYDAEQKFRRNGATKNSTLSKRSEQRAVDLGRLGP